MELSARGRGHAAGHRLGGLQHGDVVLLGDVNDVAGHHLVGVGVVEHRQQLLVDDELAVHQQGPLGDGDAVRSQACDNPGWAGGEAAVVVFRRDHVGVGDEGVGGLARDADAKARCPPSVCSRRWTA